MTTVRANNLTPVVNLFASPDSQGQKCLIQRVGTSYSFILQPLKASSTEDPQSLANFKSLIGEKRLTRIFNQPELQHYRSDYEGNRLMLNRKVLELVFLHLGNIRIEDLTEAAAALNHRELKDLSDPRIDKLYRELIPFKEVDDLFFGCIPEISYHDAVKSSGKGLEGLRERVKIQLDMYAYSLKPDLGEVEASICFAEIITSRLGDREPPMGTVLSTDQCLVYDAVFSGKGGYASILKRINGEERFLVCRGTAMHWNATGGYFSWEPGMLAVQALWPQIQDYLQKNQVEKITLLGKSQGGAQVQYLAPLIARCTQTTVCSVITYASIGVSEEAGKIFRDTFHQTNNDSPKVKVIVNEGLVKDHQMDMVPLVGGSHVGCGYHKVQVLSIVPENSAIDSFEKLSLITKAWEFIFSFNAPTRQTTLAAFTVTEIKATAAYLSRGLQLEGIRKGVAWIFYILTLGYFHVSYKKYFEAQVARAHKGITSAS